ncbi:3-deoxy-manno-octulosonate cytidylyltransferase [Hydrogenovibrio halophilus]|uniref:3-deoxy-manno-octulosonate cytidylyltransferase n=1 Tax=Hydrogenovibrio halophilus TaxID=373391 RepID=UPI00035D62F9|nr:3-deoxy-manno-octulosonate cytidylyltransferase [Hydrogenovibrio halophilus]
MMRTIALIPARYDSSRLPGKPLKTIGGKPMIQQVVERVQRARGLDAVYVATDDDRIREAVEKFGGQVVMTPAEAESGTDRIAAAANTLNLSDDTLIVNVQGDQPLIHPGSIEAVVAPFYEEETPDFAMTTLSFKIVNEAEITSPKDVKVVCDYYGNALYFSRATIPHGRDYWDHDSFKHLGVYAYTKAFVDQFNELPASRLENIEKLEQLRALEYGYRIRVIESQWDSPEVDVPGDIELMNSLMQAGH